MATYGPSNKHHSEFVYILVTPVKDEEDNLGALIESIADQNVRPIAWFIVDDASEDLTSHIINRATSEHSWIHPLKLGVKHIYDPGEHYAFVCIKGFDYALDYCKRNNIDFKYIALSDADMIYPKDYFEECISFLHDNRRFGIVSGRLLIRDQSGNIYEESRIQLSDGEPHGAGRVWRKATFIDTNGYMLIRGPDRVSNIMALLKGWKIKQLTNIVCYETRDTAGKTGLWSGYFSQGETAYFLNANPLKIFNFIFGAMFASRSKNAVIKSLAYLSGYCKSLLRREKKIGNKEVRRYQGSYKRVIMKYWLFLNGLRKRKED